MIATVASALASPSAIAAPGHWPSVIAATRPVRSNKVSTTGEVAVVTFVDRFTVALERAGDHADLLGADPSRLMVAGGGIAARAALHARDEGWPPLVRQVLFGPCRAGWPDEEASLAGACAASAVDAPEYAGRLRAAGVEVGEAPARGADALRLAGHLKLCVRFWSRWTPCSSSSVMRT